MDAIGPAPLMAFRLWGFLSGGVLKMKRIQSNTGPWF